MDHVNGDGSHNGHSYSPPLDPFDVACGCDDAHDVEDDEDGRDDDRPFPVGWDEAAAEPPNDGSACLGELLAQRPAPEEPDVHIRVYSVMTEEDEEEREEQRRFSDAWEPVTALERIASTIGLPPNLLARITRLGDDDPPTLSAMESDDGRRRARRRRWTLAIRNTYRRRIRSWKFFRGTQWR